MLPQYYQPADKRPKPNHTWEILLSVFGSLTVASFVALFITHGAIHSADIVIMFALVIITGLILGDA